jgi:hypothetical protein
VYHAENVSVITYCCDYDVFKSLRVFTTWFCVSQSTYWILFQEIYRSKVLSSYKDMVCMLTILICTISDFVSFFMECWYLQFFTSSCFLIFITMLPYVLRLCKYTVFSCHLWQDIIQSVTCLFQNIIFDDLRKFVFIFFTRCFYRECTI